MSTAVITGASRGFGLALARALAERDWDLVIDARSQRDLEAAAELLAELGSGEITALAGDVADEQHRGRLLDVAQRGDGGVSLLVNNASLLGPSPQPTLAEYPLDVLEDVLRANTLAPLRLAQLFLPDLRKAGGTLVNITSDAAVEPYEGWGGYGSSKAALEQLSSILAAEEHEVRIYWFDPGDMNTRMHQEAFPGEDISDRPLPETRVPALLRLLDEARPSGRYTASNLLPPDGGAQ